MTGWLGLLAVAGALLRVSDVGGLAAGAGEGLKWHQENAAQVVIIVTVLDNSRIRILWSHGCFCSVDILFHTFYLCGEENTGIST